MLHLRLRQTPRPLPAKLLLLVVTGAALTFCAGRDRGPSGHHALFENPGFANHWLKVRVTGTVSNRSGIGARLRVVVREGSRERSIYRTVSNGSSFGANPLLQEIGVGGARRIERLEVTWPATGKTQRFAGLPVDRAFEVVEGSARPVPLPLRAAPFVPRSGPEPEQLVLAHHHVGHL